MFKEFLLKCLTGQSLTEQEAKTVMNEIMSGTVSSAQIGSLLTILTYRGETIEEITGFVRGMRENMIPLQTGLENVVDTCGTGGDGASTFNISTASAIVASAAGVKVAKHGNRAVSSKSGSADVLEYLGIDITSTKQEVIETLKQDGMAFLFAPMYHPAMKHAAIPRKELGFRTVFNALGPLANPSNCDKQVIGVYSAELAEKLARTLQKLSSRHVLFVAGKDGLDEISVETETDIVELRDGDIRSYTIKPEDFGLERGRVSDLVVETAKESAHTIEQIFRDQAHESAKNAVILNAAAAIYVAGKAGSIAEGTHIARTVIENGTAYRQLQKLRARKVMTQHA
ncbi:anthranilate phosphoribosyltransferase [Priestia koreensis]|uniref:anthranilate phosphoribosyltransferase n=1 Tax=Priestia koreensis TaxID=284581 RepID=UPI001F59AB74|nr:anthranilate phosphoribosyltransferase [Priestia koreensis]MCM3003914.1 anthranilate phosphoribosyltransferase [Priestia koreensis]UNL84013.1 anthranilate phosphoribosyltransferase [Priestia koreensis]